MRLVALLALIFSCLTMAGCTTSAFTRADNTARVDHLTNVTIAMVHTYKGDTHSMCTGTWISKSVILTANHCVEGLAHRLGEEQLLEAAAAQGVDSEMLEMMLALGAIDPPYVDPATVMVHFIQANEVTNVGQEPSADHIANVLKLSKQDDIALLQVVNPGSLRHEVAQLAEESPAVGEDVYFMGHQNGLYWSYMKGMVSAYRDDMSALFGDDSQRDIPFMQVQAPVWHGNSGGGAFNSSGELVGMADFITRAPDMGFCVHLETIRGFLIGQHLIAMKIKPNPKE